MSLFQRIRNVLRPNRLQRDLQRELDFHLRERIDELLESGAASSEREAEYLARRQFGNYGKHLERTRDMDLNLFLDAAGRNLRYAARSLAKTPGFTATVIVTLALGIGANSAVFSAIHAVILKPLPFPSPDRLMTVEQAHPRIPQPFLAPVRLQEWNRLNSTFESITGHFAEDASEVSGVLPEKMRRVTVAPRFLQTLGVAPLLGRDFAPQEERFGGPNAVIISHRLWQNRFSGSLDAIGKSLRFSSRYSATIIGIMPATFQYPEKAADLWIPAPMDAPYAQSRLSTWFHGVGRLKPGVTPQQASADLAAVQANLARQFPATDKEVASRVQPLKEVTVGGITRSLWLLYASVTLLLLIACTNIAALLMSRSAARQHEIAVRYSLGASRSTVAAQLFTEVLVLAIAGATAGLLVAAAASQVFQTLARDIPRVDQISLDWRVLLYSLVCALAATILCAMAPVIRSTRQKAPALAPGGNRTSTGLGTGATRYPIQLKLVAVQVSLAVTLLAGAALLLRSFHQLSQVSPGFDPSNTLAFQISTSWGETSDLKANRVRTTALVEALHSLPGVQAATVTVGLPGIPSEYEVELKPAEGRAETDPRIVSRGRLVTPHYFATLSIPLITGELCRADTNGNPTMMVNRVFANRFLGGATDPSAVIGRQLIALPKHSGSVPITISGVVGDARETGLHREPPPVAYWCNAFLQPGGHFLVRAASPGAVTPEAIRRKLRELEPFRSAYNFTPLADHISDAYAENRLRTVLLAFFACTALALASVGLYGTLSYLVQIRQREVAVRMALGALRSQVLRHFLAQGLQMATIGCIAGMALALASGRTLSGMLFGISASDTTTLAGVVITVLTVAVFASLLPAARAARVEPMRALREE